jgi:hypothetical protein
MFVLGVSYESQQGYIIVCTSDRNRFDEKFVFYNSFGQFEDKSKQVGIIFKASNRLQIKRQENNPKIPLTKQIAKPEQKHPSNLILPLAILPPALDPFPTPPTPPHLTQFLSGLPHPNPSLLRRLDVSSHIRAG